jgi:hypothetical protein
MGQQLRLRRLVRHDHQLRVRGPIVCGSLLCCTQLCGPELLGHCRLRLLQAALW